MDSGWTGPPKRILLATDLSARCDRALDRAVGLAGLWGAELVIVHALEQDDDETTQRLPFWRRADAATLVERQLRQDLAGRPVKIVVEKGEPADLVDRVAEAEACDLIVIGLAQDEPFGRFRLGATVDRLLRKTNVPLLVVRQRARGPYDEILVATDFSESSRYALDIASGFFAHGRLHLFHAYDTPLAGMTQDLGAYREGARSTARAKAEEFLREAGIAEARRQQAALIIERGEPAQLVQEYSRDRGIDLVVLGTHGHGAVFDLFVGSVAKSILASLPCDALIVREPRARHRS